MVSSRRMSPQMTPDIQTATVLVNTAARGVAGRFASDRVLEYLRGRGIEVQVVTPGSAAEATREAHAAALRGDDVLFVVGGDGSLRDAAGGLAGSRTALAPIRGGTANVLAHEIGVPRGIREALDAHLDGERVPMDVGRAGDKPFLLMAGIGWDAEVARNVRRGLKRWLGPAAYIAEGAITLPRLHTRPVRWSCDGEAHDEPLGVMIIGNTRLYGAVIHVTPQAMADDGMLDVCALCPRRTADGTRIATKLLFRRHEGDARAFSARVREVEVETPGLLVQLDGDQAAETPLRFTVEPRALLLSLPAGKRPPIFGP